MQNAQTKQDNAIWPLSEPATLLCIDDEPNILSSLARVFRGQFFNCITTTDPDEVLSIIENQPVHVVLSDQRMPELQGTELLEKIKNINPEIIRAILSGYSDIGAILDSINKSYVFKFISKPWKNETLVSVVHECFDQYLRTHEPNGTYIPDKDENVSLVPDADFAFNQNERIIETLPNPIIGIDGQLTMRMVNAEARKVFKNIHKTNDATQHFSKEVIDTIITMQVCEPGESIRIYSELFKCWITITASDIDLIGKSVLVIME